MPSLYANHVAKWQDCRRCPLCETRQRVVFARGSIPCDLLLIGEAPGVSEDCLGVPFVGPAGKLLDAIVADAVGGLYTSPEVRGWDAIRVCFYNLVGCIPRDREGVKSGEPEHESIEACRPKLNEFIGIAKPQLLVCVGKLAETWLDDIWVRRGLRVAKIDHPAHILRMSIHGRGLAIQRAVVTIRTALHEVLDA